MVERRRRRRRNWRVWLPWVAGAALLGVYLSLPEADDSQANEPIPGTLDGEHAPKLTILQALPKDPSAGGALVVQIDRGSAAQMPGDEVSVWMGKRELTLLAARSDSLVVQLPGELPPGRIKLRVAIGDERSKPFEVRVKAINWRKPFRNLCGGLALLILGVRALAGGARGAISLSSARIVAALARSRLAALSFGVGAGSALQSTTGVAGLLAGLVNARVLGEVPAAAAFLGAQVGASAVLLMAASALEPRAGLIVLAIGALAAALAPNRRSRAAARVVLGVGLVMFGVQVLRPGLEPFVFDPLVLKTIDRIAPDDLLGSVVTVLFGASLVAILQGPAPVLLLALAIAELTGHSGIRMTLVLLSGSGLGAGLAALLTSSGDARSRRLGRLHLLVGALVTLFCVITSGAFAALAQRLAQQPEPWSSHARHLLPAFSWPLAVAFVLSQLTAAGILLPILPLLQRSLERLYAGRLRAEAAQSGDGDELVEALVAQKTALPAILALALDGRRGAGEQAEAQLRDAEVVLSSSFSELSAQTAPIALGCLQLQRALEDVLQHAERLTERRIAWHDSGAHLAPLAERDRSGLREMHDLLGSGLASLIAHLRSRTLPDSDEMCAREIQINATEARMRRGLLAAPSRAARELGLLELVDAYETAGNQLFRVADALSQPSAAPASYLEVEAPAAKSPASAEPERTRP